MHRESLDQVTVADEWAFVLSYLEIESLRLEERLRLHLEADRRGALADARAPTGSRISWHSSRMDRVSRQTSLFAWQKSP